MFHTNLAKPYRVTFITPTTYRRFASLKQQPALRDQIQPKEKNNDRNDIEKMLEKWRLKVGFEFHVQIQTKHKMFSSKKRQL